MLKDLKPFVNKEQRQIPSICMNMKDQTVKQVEKGKRIVIKKRPIKKMNSECDKKASYPNFINYVMKIQRFFRAKLAQKSIKKQY